jgi:hypothetical protein
LSSLIFLLTAEDYANLDEREERRIRKAKKDEFVRLVNDELADFADKKDKLEYRLSSYGDTDVSEQAQAMIAEVNDIREHIAQANERGKRLVGEIMSVRQEIADCDMSLNRAGTLIYHLKSDVARLSLVADGDFFLDDIPLPERCPYCDGEISHENRPDYVKCSQSELGRIVEELNTTQAVADSEKERRVTLGRTLAQFETEKSNIDRLVNEKLKPRQYELDSVLKNFKAVSQIQAEIALIVSFANDRTVELQRRDNADEVKVEYHVKDNFDADFKKAINEYVQHTFELCRYENLTSAHFSIDKFEVFVNGQDKATSHGQGYRAFINTVLALAFRKYLVDNGKYAPGLFVVDSPLQSLSQGVDEEAPESMKTGLFRYLLENQSDGQAIVIENNIPNLNYGDYNVKPIEFTGGKKSGRYGFLYLDGQF